MTKRKEVINITKSTRRELYIYVPHEGGNMSFCSADADTGEESDIGEHPDRALVLGLTYEETLPWVLAL